MLAEMLPARRRDQGTDQNVIVFWRGSRFHWRKRRAIEFSRRFVRGMVKVLVKNARPTKNRKYHNTNVKSRFKLLMTTNPRIEEVIRRANAMMSAIPVMKQILFTARLRGSA